jgi:cbb3-type cytochrome oxidase subunit 3
MIALETKRESAQMRSIALLTMIYLPLSCVASVFSTTLFNWNPSDGEPIVSKYIWVLLTLALVLTLITVLAWHFTTNREKKREGKRSRTFDTVLSDAV